MSRYEGLWRGDPDRACNLRSRGLGPGGQGSETWDAVPWKREGKMWLRVFGVPVKRVAMICFFLGKKKNTVGRPGVGGKGMDSGLTPLPSPSHCISGPLYKLNGQDGLI